MSTQVQLRRGSTTEHNSFTGAAGEVTVDTTKKTLVVHDGSTAGGVPLAKESALSSYVPTSAIGSTVQAYNANTAVTNAVQSFTAAQRGAVTALTDGATVTPDFSLSNNWSLTLGGSRTLANPTNLTAGQTGVIVITNGAYTLSFGGYWKFPGGTAPTLTQNGTDVLAYYVDSSTRITARLIADVK